MRKLVLTGGFFLAVANLGAQQPCPRSPVVINTPEDQLMLAVNGAETPQAQVEALNKFVAEHADSGFIPCVNEYLTMTYLKMQDYDKAIEAGEKDVAAQYLDVNLIVNLLKAYVGAGKASDGAFDLINKGPQVIHDEMMTTPSGTAEEVEKARQASSDAAKDVRAYMEYAFFQLLPRVAEPPKRVQFLDAFVKAYPDTPNTNQVNVQYFAAYQMAGDADKMFEYGNKAVASDPTNVSTLNLVADAFATARTPRTKEAIDYAKKALDLATSMQKPEGTDDAQFKAYRDTQMGLAHASIGYVQLQEGSKTHKVAPAITEFKTAVDLLTTNPQLQARTLYFLGYANEVLYPPNHKAAADALTRCAAMQTPWQGQAQELLAKVKSAH
jgi:tetratricopeptide (TPR) repeat protein